MARYVYIWELGGGMGHLQRMQAISSQFEAAGHKVLWYVPPEKLSSASRLWRDVRAAPIAPRPRTRVREPGSFAEILQNEGWDQPQQVKLWIQLWQHEFASSRAEHVLLDFAPNALLAAIAEHRQVTVMGTGFYIPPCQSPLPAFRQDQGVYADRLLWAEQRIATVLSQALQEPISGLCDLLHHANVSNQLLTYPEWDHYAGRRSGRHPGRSNRDLQQDIYRGLVTGFSGHEAAWPACGGQRVFAYLKPFPCLAILLETFRQMGLNVQIHGNEEIAGLVKALNAEHIGFCEHPVDERSIAAADGVMINHAGHDGSIKAALAGLALWQLPLNIEQLLTATNAQQLGIADWTHANAYPEFPAALTRLLEQKQARQQAAQSWAKSVKPGSENWSQENFGIFRILRSI
jgi:hypothetical protein